MILKPQIQRRLTVGGDWHASSYLEMIEDVFPGIATSAMLGAFQTTVCLLYGDGIGTTEAGYEYRLVYVVAP